jgi:hypothetical protein
MRLPSATTSPTAGSGLHPLRTRRAVTPPAQDQPRTSPAGASSQLRIQPSGSHREPRRPWNPIGASTQPDACLSFCRRVTYRHGGYCPAIAASTVAASATMISKPKALRIFLAAATTLAPGEHQLTRWESATLRGDGGDVGGCVEDGCLAGHTSPRSVGTRADRTRRWSEQCSAAPGRSSPQAGEHHSNPLRSRGHPDSQISRYQGGAAIPASALPSTQHDQAVCFWSWC